MEEVFVPEVAASYRWISAAGILVVVAVVWTISAYRGPTTRNSKLGQLLGPMLILFGLSSLVMVGLDLSKSPIIVVAPGYAIIGNDTLLPGGLSRAYLEPVSVSGLAGRGGTQDLGIIEYTDGTQLVLAADEYDTRAVVAAMRKLKE